MCFEGVWIESDRLFKFGNGFIRPSAKLKGEALRGVRFSERVVQRDGLRARRQNTINSDVANGLLEQKRIAIRDAGISPRIDLVQFDRFGEHLARQLIISLRSAPEKLPTS